MTNPFENCETIDETMFMVLDLAGPEGLKELLAEVDLDREDLSQASDKLKAAGLVDGAQLLRDAAKEAPTRAAREISRIMADPLPANRKCYFREGWGRGYFSVDDLIVAGVDPQEFESITKAVSKARQR